MWRYVKQLATCAPEPVVRLRWLLRKTAVVCFAPSFSTLCEHVKLCMYRVSVLHIRGEGRSHQVCDGHALHECLTLRPSVCVEWRRGVFCDSGPVSTPQHHMWWRCHFQACFFDPCAVLTTSLSNTTMFLCQGSHGGSCYRRNLCHGLHQMGFAKAGSQSAELMAWACMFVISTKNEVLAKVPSDDTSEKYQSKGGVKGCTCKLSCMLDHTLEVDPKKTRTTAHLAKRM